MSALSQLNTNSNTEINIGPFDSGNSEYTGSLRINGNLEVNGNITYVDQLNVNDAFIQVASNNTGTVSDMGLVATINANTFAGLRWDTTVGSWQTSTSVTANGQPVNVYTNVVSGPPNGPNSNTQVIFADGPYDLGSSPNFTFDKDANLLTVTGNSSTTGNVDAGNVNTGGEISATGNIIVGNVNTSGLVSAVGDVIGGNITTVGQVSAVGNVTSDTYFIGNGWYITDVFARGANADTLEGQTLSSNVIYSSLTTVATLTSLSVAGNTDTGNLLTAGLISAAGTITSNSNITGANINTAGIISAIGNAYLGNVDAENHTGTNVSVTGSVSAASLNLTNGVTATDFSATGNITADGFMSAAGNITGGNINTVGVVSTTSNVVAGNISTPSLSGANLGVTATAGNLNLSATAGNIVLNNVYINNLRDPIQDQDAATKNYVDNSISAGLEIHEQVAADTDANVSATYVTGGTTPTWTTITAGSTLSTGSAHGLVVNDVIVFGITTNGITAGTPYFVYSAPTATSITLSDNYNGAQLTTLTNGTGLTITSRANSGVGATLTSTTNGPLVAEGYTCLLNDRVLVNAQTDATQNGVYYVSQAGVAGPGGTPWILTRASDGNKYGQNSPNVMDVGAYFLVTGGDDQGESYVMTTSGTIVFGTTNIVFSEFSQITPYTAGTGLTLTNFQFSVNPVQTQITTVGTLGNLSVAGNTQTGNLLTSGIVSAGGNITGGNIATTGTVSATGNLTSGNVNTAGLVTVGGNVVAGNVNTAGVVTATGNITGGNLISIGEISSASNVTTSLYYFGDGSFLTNVQLAGLQIVNGTSNVKIPNANSNIYMSVDGTANIVTVANTGITVNGIASVSGNITALNVNAANTVTAITISASGNVTGGNIMTNGNVSAAGNLNVNGISLTGNINSPINTTYNITTTGNLTANNIFANITTIVNGTSNVQIGTANGNANISIGGVSNVVVVTTAGTYTTGIASVSGNVISSNVVTGIVTASGNVVGGNINTAGVVSATGNVVSNNVNAVNSVTGVVVSASGNVIGGNINTAGIVSASGNVYGANFVSRYTDGTALGLIGSTPVAANTTGGAISVVAGNGTSNIGGAISLTAGAGDSGSNVGIGGAINVIAGQGTSNAAGGLTTIRGGNSGVSLGAGLLLYGGNVDGLQTAGNAQLSGGALTAGTDLQGGSLTLAAGAGTGAGTASQVVIKAPAVTTSGTSVQSVGNIAVFDSTGLAVIGLISATGNIISNGGLINVPGGQVNANNITTNYFTSYYEANVANLTSRYTNGTALDIRGGNTLTANAIGGAVRVTGGVGNGLASGGAVIINAGDAGSNSGSTGAGGNVEINGGRGYGTGFGFQGGYVKLSAGNSISVTSTGYGSYLTLNPGASTNSGGNAFLTGGMANTTASDAAGGVVFINGGTGTGYGQPGNIVFSTTDKLIAANTTVQTAYQRLVISDTQANITFSTPSTSTTTGALRVGGGVGVAGNINSGGYLSVTGNVNAGNVIATNLTGTLLTAAQTNITSVGTLGSLSVTGNINAGNVNATNLSGTLLTAAQTNITSVGTLGSLSVTGNVNAGNVNATNLSGTLLTAAQTNITSVGTLGSLSVTGTVTAGNLVTAGTTGTVSVNSITHTGTNATGNIGSSSSYFATVYAANIVGTASSALYADVAEVYQADAAYNPTTVVVFGGSKEITQSTKPNDTRIAGVVSTNPAYLMNSGDTRENATPVALLGRVPCRVVGNIRKGDQLVSSTIPGVATKYSIDNYNPGMIIGKALEDYNSDTPGIIEVVIGRL